MPVIIDTEENTVIARLSGEIDHHTAKELRTDIDLAIDRLKPATLILDFDGVTFMDSSGIGLVMGRYKMLKPWGGSIIIENTGNQIKKVMRLAGLDRLAVIK
ncbi:MAG: anti-sigma factor antagonist [Oscillospiraceae bacterium]|nr:anti-sigma factor antagonist [Oscillospiraceae bacterium]